jgi:Cold shock proteins
MARPTDPSPIRHGTLKRVVRDKGFGFIADGQGAEYFFHRTAAAFDLDDVAEGAAVTFLPSSGSKGPRAEDVRLVD